MAQLQFIGETPTYYLLLLAVPFLGVRLRLHTVSHDLGITLVSDEAIVGLMANHILEGSGHA